MRNLKCPVCGREFETNASRVKFCSPECSKKGDTLRGEAWRKAHPNYNQEYYKNVLKDRRAERKAAGR